MVRGALVALIELEPDFKVVASIRNGSDIVPTALACQPDVSIIDIDLPGRAGTIRRAFTARVSGYLLKDAPPEELASAIRNIAAGGKVIDPQLAVTAWDDRQNPLSAREHEVLRLTAAGADPAEIATIMHLSIGTVRNYLTTIVTKLNARTRVDAVKSAYDAGWLP
jgi:two-component system, NarL family, response regulator DesR